MSRRLHGPGHLMEVLADAAALPRVLQANAEMLFREAERARLHAWLAHEIRARQLEGLLGSTLVARVRSADSIGHEFERAVKWEVNRLRRALEDLKLPIVLLKGAAYVCAALPPATGRLVADVDILVPVDRLNDVETALLSHGWAFEPLEAYDVRYYRRWMHELPPMRHQQRRAQLDVHHAILPRSGRLRPDSARLLDRSVELEGQGVRVLCPSHMVLHAAVHLFQDGEVAGGIREIFDLHRMLEHFGRDAAFWTDFENEARALGLTRPAYYAVRYASRFCGTAVPDGLREPLSDWAPSAPALVVMDRLVASAFEHGSGGGLARWWLYARAHWLRMPPWLLAQHLVSKAWRRSGLAT